MQFGAKDPNVCLLVGYFQERLCHSPLSTIPRRARTWRLRTRNRDKMSPIPEPATTLFFFFDIKNGNPNGDPDNGNMTTDGQRHTEGSGHRCRTEAKDPRKFMLT